MKRKYIIILFLLLAVTICILWRSAKNQSDIDPGLLKVAQQTYPDKGNTYHLKKIDGDWAVVSVGFTPGGGAEVIAKRENGVWRKVATGNEYLDCTLVEQEKIPLSIYGSCMDYKTGVIYPVEEQPIN